MKAADSHKNNRSLFHAARCFEQVSSIKSNIFPFSQGKYYLCLRKTCGYNLFSYFSRPSGDFDFERTK